MKAMARLEAGVMKPTFMKRFGRVAALVTGLGLVVAASPAAATGITKCYGEGPYNTTGEIYQGEPGYDQSAYSGWVKFYPELRKFNGYGYVHHSWGYQPLWLKCEGVWCHWFDQNFNELESRYHIGKGTIMDGTPHYFSLPPGAYRTRWWVSYDLGQTWPVRIAPAWYEGASDDYSRCVFRPLG